MLPGNPSSSPYWWEAAPRPVLPPVEPPPRIDVAVIGSGYTGLSAALTLARADRSVLVLERGLAGEGASSRNAGICSGNLKPSFSSLARRIGLERACAIYAEGVAARTWLRELIESEEIECDYDLVGRYTAACSPKSYEALAREAEIMRRHVGLPVHVVPRAEQHAEIGSERYFGGEVREDIAGFHPGRFHLGLLGRAIDAGALVAQETEVHGVRREGDAFEVHTTRGRVRARDVVVATNGYTTPGLPWLRRRLVPVPASILATAPVGDNLMRKLIPKRRMVGESRRVVGFFRPSPDGRRILTGGRGGLTDASRPRAFVALYREMVATFPELDGVEITHAWHGFVAFTRDLLPHVAVEDGVHYACGFNGSGTVWATWLGRKAALHVLGESEGETAFARGGFPGIPFYDGRPWFLGPIIGWQRLLDRVGW